MSEKVIEREPLILWIDQSHDSQTAHEILVSWVSGKPYDLVEKSIDTDPDTLVLEAPTLRTSLSQYRGLIEIIQYAVEGLAEIEQVQRRSMKKKSGLDFKPSWLLKQRASLVAVVDSIS